MSVSGLTVTPPRQRNPVLRDIHFDINEGEIALLSGPSGSGKTTLLKTINGLIPWMNPYHMSGEVYLGGTEIDDLDPGQRSHLIGTCLDRPENQLFLQTPKDEIAHAGNRYQTDPAIKDMLVEHLGIAPLRDRRIAELSSGERQRVALATTLMAAGRPILLDEPTAHLDPQGVEALTKVAVKLAHHNSSFLVAEHASWRWDKVANKNLQMKDSQLSPFPVIRGTELSRSSHTPGEKILLNTKGLYGGRKGQAIFGPIDLALHEGEIVALTGSNGAGKSTLARTLSSWMKPIKGQTKTLDDKHPTLMLPEAELQLFGRTVQRELAGHCNSSEELARILRRHRVEHLSARPPWTLSRGEQQRLVHAVHDIMQPSVMIMDEPAQGLGSEDLKSLVNLIHRRAEKGRAYLLITHRSDLAAIAHRHLHLENGQLQEVRS